MGDVRKCKNSILWSVKQGKVIHVAQTISTYHHPHFQNNLQFLAEGQKSESVCPCSS